MAQTPATAPPNPFEALRNLAPLLAAALLAVALLGIAAYLVG